jgi:hypothetical protein
VALCFVAVLGISLAGYIALCSRTMTLSNRSFHDSLGKQLAEAGMEEALRAFNKNDWSDWSASGFIVNWTLDATNRRATATLDFPTGTFGQGTTATVKIRVDNYDAGRLGSTWSSTGNYRSGDLVGYNGTWYRSVQSGNTNHTPGDLAWWAPAPVPWTWSSDISYALYDVVNYNGSWYRSTTSSNTSTPPTNWASIPTLAFSWSGSTTYTTGSYVYITDRWYRCVADCTGIMPPNSSYWRTDAPYISWSWRYSPAKAYSFNDVVYYDGKWWRCVSAHTANNSAEYPGNTTDWEDALGGSNTTSSAGASGWSSSSINYQLDDVVYYSTTSQWYRCIKAHTSSSSLSPTNATYWVNTPLLSTAWDSVRQYSLNDTVRYNGVWYLSIHGGTSNVAQNPSTASSAYWVGADTTSTSYAWNATTSYATGAYRCYGGVWYRCTASHTNKSPNDIDYWTAVGAPVVYVEAAVTISNSPTLKTQIRAPIAPAPLFPNAAGASTNLTVTTAGGTVDSYDYSLGTGYAAQVGTSTNSSAVLAAGSTLAINGATTIKGYLAWPSPPSGISNGTTLNGVSFSTDKSRVSRSPYIPSFEIQHDSDSSSNYLRGTALDLSTTTTSIGTPGGTTPTRYYYNGSMNIGSSYGCSTLNINGPVILYINGYVRIQSGGKIEIRGTGSLELHCSYARTYSGSEGFYNRTLDPKKLVVIADSSSTSTAYLDHGTGTNKDFCGVYYAPNITATLGLDIRTGVNVYGALSAKEITFSAESDLHYDTSLRYATIGGVDQPYAVTEWRELPASEQATMP